MKLKLLIAIKALWYKTYDVLKLITSFPILRKLGTVEVKVSPYYKTSLIFWSLSQSNLWAITDKYLAKISNDNFYINLDGRSNRLYSKNFYNQLNIYNKKLLHF